MRRPLTLPFALLAAAAVTFAAADAAEAQTLQQVAAQGACSTAGVTKLSDQLVQVQMCISPGTFVAFTPHAGVTLTGTQIHPYLLATSRDALWAAAKTTPVQVNSAFRTIADQYVLYYSGACALAATPGNSNHETGRAVDLENWSAANAAMAAAGCVHSYPSTDPVHFDCPGADHRADSILAFQMLWNVNNPGDVIAEDGAYGPMTEARLAKSPSTGFAKLPPCGATTPDWAAEFVSQSYPLASVGALTMTVGQELDGYIELKNVGGKGWDGKTFLATTMPRDRASLFVATGWTSATRPAGVGGVVSPGGTHKFQFRLHAPATVGDYTEHFGVVEEGVAWFSDPAQGGPSDDQLQVKIHVVAVGGDGGVDDAGGDAAADDGGAGADAGPDGGGLDGGDITTPADATGSSVGCGCVTAGGDGGASGLAAGALLGLALVGRHRRGGRRRS
jgi:MYXO-CTERM domain-containing protein